MADTWPTMSQREAIGHAYDIVGVDIETEWWFRDPISLGLHSEEDAGYGRSYRDTEHCCYPWHIEAPADRQMTTIVLPNRVTIPVVVHELGHAFDYWTWFEMETTPVSWYAPNRDEVFAEAFTAFLIPGYETDPDIEARSWFEAHGLVWWRND